MDAVNEAIERIGFVRNLSAANLAKSKQYRFLFLLPRHGDLFVSELGNHIEEADAALKAEGIDLRYQSISQNDPHEITRALDAINPEDVDGIALMAPESPQVRDAAIRLKERGIQVVHLISGQQDMSGLDFVGIDNRAAGATAARLIGRFCAGRQGKVMIVTETMNARDSLERRLGLDEVLTTDFPHLTALPSMETYGDEDRAKSVISTSIEKNSDIVAIYIMSSEARAPLAALTGTILQSKPIILAHELTERTRKGLVSGELDALIVQNPGHLVRSAVRLLRAGVDGRSVLKSQEQIRIEILIKENLLLEVEPDS